MTASGTPNGSRTELIYLSWRTTWCSVKHSIGKGRGRIRKAESFLFREEDGGSPGEMSNLLTGINQGDNTTLPSVTQPTLPYVSLDLSV